MNLSGMYVDTLFKLNSNIRCIEMTVLDSLLDGLELLNSNIRCIEMCFTDYICEDVFKLNSNIRCIEIMEQVIVTDLMKR